MRGAAREQDGGTDQSRVANQHQCVFITGSKGSKQAALFEKSAQKLL
jgi:hypothetical protein